MDLKNILIRQEFWKKNIVIRDFESETFEWIAKITSEQISVVHHESMTAPEDFKVRKLKLNDINFGAVESVGEFSEIS